MKSDEKIEKANNEEVTKNEVKSTRKCPREF